MPRQTVLIVGASDLGTACALRLFHSGFHIVIIEKDCPFDIYHSRSFSSAVFSGSRTIENVKAKTYAQALDEDALKPDSNISDFLKFTILNREIPVMLESEKSYLRQLSADYCIICQPNLYEKIKSDISEECKIIGFAEDINMRDNAYTICNSGQNFGRVLYANDELLIAESNITQHKKDIYYQIKAPIEGVFQSSKSIDELIREKEEIGKIGNIPILSPVLGRISGILNSGVIIPAGIVFVEIDTSHSGMSGYLLFRDSFCLSGAVLEAIMHDSDLNKTVKFLN